jgi:octaprenyl-diphosphate synthase
MAAEMQAVDDVIRRRLTSEVALVDQIANYIVGAGGKRIRPRLVLLFSRALSFSGASRFELAAIIEFIHTATLLHDDVVDESALRRGRATANALFGNAASVLVGDFLYSRAFQLMVEVGRMRVLDVLADATNVIAEGEVLQLMNMHDADLAVEDYLRVIRYKTAKLFEASARLGAVIADAPREIEDACANFGRSLGTAFQLIDDLLDYEGDPAALGKNVGDDLREGKPTPLLARAVAVADDDQRAVLARVGAPDLCADEVTAIQRVIVDTGALDALEERIAALAEEAVAALDRAPIAAEAGAELAALAAFVVARAD